MTRTFRALLAMLAVAVAAAVFVEAPAAQAADPIWSYSNQGTGKCIDDTPAGFRTYNCNGTNAQKWIVHSWNDGTVRFQNVNTGRCIYDGNQGFRTLTCNSSTNQSWWVVYWADNTRRFQNQATGYCMEDSILGLRTVNCDSSQWESWYRL
ncbi:hypothetical protein Rhe02_80740 [Rhizocola hellebori]|uniref:Ricin B lectin domain-containing protein n=1 Tax=Rhizocola hellebori TaxID=1392758 RepID=A0A8J3QH92_9ACTN|nr:RICIN domain-containing protein [Rhizocola hellebori]GIH10007.1 hypothetical protein Rhe02_80740 [Rhizocola hellebori]